MADKAARPVVYLIEVVDQKGDLDRRFFSEQKDARAVVRAIRREGGDVVGPNPVRDPGGLNWMRAPGITGQYANGFTSGNRVTWYGSPRLDAGGPRVNATRSQKQRGY